MKFINLVKNINWRFVTTRVPNVRTSLVPVSCKESKKYEFLKIILHGSCSRQNAEFSQRNAKRIIMHACSNCPAHCLCSRSCGFLKRLTLPPNGVLLILIPGVFFDRLKGYFVEDQFLGETSLANLAAAEASSEEDQSSK